MTDAPIPPLWVPLSDLAQWLRDMHRLTECEIRDVILDVRRLPTDFRVSYSAEDDEIIWGWPDWAVNWLTGRARRKQPLGKIDDSPIDFPLVVSWDAVTSAVRRMRRDRLALEAPATAAPEVPPLAEQVAEAAPAAAKRRHNGTDFRAADAPLAIEMRALIENKSARSPEDAARAVVSRAVGHGEDASKVKRLAKHYRETHPDKA